MELSVNDMPIEGFPSAPVLSPDGTNLAFTRLGKGVFLVNSDGNNLRALVNAPFAVAPTWSHEARYLAYEDTVDGYTKVKFIRADGTDGQQINSDSGEFDQSPAWKP